MTPQIVDEAAIRAAVSFDQASISAVADAFALLAGGSPVVMPPVMQINVDAVHGQTCVKSAFTPGAAHFVVKLASTFHDNVRIGLPSASGLMLVCSAATGQVETILLDNGYLTALRTQAAGAVAARHLARPDARTAAIIGSGRQARLQLAALRAVRPIETARVWSPDADGCAAFARDMAEALGITVVSAPSAEAAVRGADIVVTATPARAPIVRADWLSPGQHITAMGADAPGKSELFPDVISRTTLYVPDRDQQCRTLSELAAALAAGTVSSSFQGVELGDIVAGRHPGRARDTDITVADLTGLGVQDTAIALLARARLSELELRDQRDPAHHEGGAG